MWSSLNKIIKKAGSIAGVYERVKGSLPDQMSEKVVLHETMTKAEEEKFLAQQQNKLMRVKAESPQDVSIALKVLCEAANDTIKFCEIQKTKREEIKAHRDAIIRRIDKTAELVKLYLDNTFDERRYQFENYFRLVDKALETNDQNLLTCTLNNINQLSASSPFKNLEDIVVAINNPETEWDV